MSDAATITPELLTTDEAAALCGVSRRHFLQLASSGRVGPRALRLGSRSVRWSRRELVAWIDAGCPGRLQFESVSQVDRQARRS
jgi:excisionase family DNA binding protein